MPKSNVALSNLRAVVIVIVLAFHSSLAYLASAPAQMSTFAQAPYRWQAFPIVDPQRWLGFDIFCAWQDVSLMSLMFFLSGLLASGSLLRKGPRSYVADRLWRIGLPFALAVAFLSPLSFYPAYLARTADASFIDFCKQWLALPTWPAGPQWFLWQLLALNTLAASFYAAAPGYIERLRRLGEWAGTRPVKFFALLIAASALGYVPLALIYSPWSWSAIGPFSLQLSRPLHNFVFFFAGGALGGYGLDRGLLARDGPLARYWLGWLGTGIIGFMLWGGVTSLTWPDWDRASFPVQFLASLAFPAACAGGCIGMVALCLRFGHRRSAILDSLSANAYSMYLLHYVFVVWLQYALLASGLIAAGKMVIVLAGSLVMSWTSSLAFNRLAATPYLTAAKRAILPVPR